MYPKWGKITYYETPKFLLVTTKEMMAGKLKTHWRNEKSTGNLKGRYYLLGIDIDESIILNSIL
jgi:hypothetical protein